MIQSAHECFAIPQMNLLELVSLEGDQVQTKIEMLYNTPIYRLRGDILPLLCLKKELNLGSFFEEREAAIKADDISQMQMNIIVLQADEQKFGLIVDEISDTEEIVVKPLSKQLKSLSVYAGATILGTGKVALILDIMGLAKQAKLLSEEQQLKIAKADNNLQEKQFERHSLLMFKATQNRTMSLPISKVSRLEEFHQSDIQSTGELQIIRYSKKILPLIFLSDVFSSLKQVPLPAAAELLPVIVCSVNNNHVGLVVHEILDIVETDENFEIQYSIKREGVLGSIILSDNVMDILDFKAIVLRKLPEFFDDHANKIALAAVR
jgi:two-component system chemotaxis sensor kinase CheA